MKILAINPGSTSTKIAVFEDETPVLVRTIIHSPEELAGFDDVIEQRDFRRQLVLDELHQANIPVEFDAVIGRGGLVKPLEGGTYEINDLMIQDTHSGIALHNHACNLGSSGYMQPQPPPSLRWCPGPACTSSRGRLCAQSCRVA